MGLLLQFYELRWMLAVAGLAFYAIAKIRTYNRLKAFKGPFSTGFSELWHTRVVMSTKSHLIYKDVCDKYGMSASSLSTAGIRILIQNGVSGTVARVGPNDLVTSSLELLTHMSSVRSPYTRGAWYYGATRHRPGRTMSSASSMKKSTCGGGIKWPWG